MQSIHITVRVLTGGTHLQEVRILNDTGLVAAWASPSSLSLAASCGSVLATAQGNSVTLINVHPATGRPAVTQTLRFSQQLSALALLELPSTLGEVRATLLRSWLGYISLRAYQHMLPNALCGQRTWVQSFQLSSGRSTRHSLLLSNTAASQKMLVCLHPG